MHVFLLVGVGLGGYGDVFVVGYGETWCSIGTVAAAGAVGGYGLGACTLCSHTVVLGVVCIGSAGTL